MNVPADACTEAIVQGKLMELKGKMVQAGLTNSRAIHMTYAEYLDRLKKAGYVPSMGQTSQDTLPTTALSKAPPIAPPMEMGSQPDAAMTNLAAENEELRERLRMAEGATAEAMNRAEILAAESIKQKEVAANQTAEMENLRKMALQKDSKNKPMGTWRIHQPRSHRAVGKWLMQFQCHRTPTRKPRRREPGPKRPPSDQWAVEPPQAIAAKYGPRLGTHDM